MKHRFKKSIVALVLACAFMASSLGAGVTAFAASDRQQYTKVDDLSSLISDAEIHVYTTTGGGSVGLVDSSGATFAMGSGYRRFMATANEGWVFDGWTTQISLGSKVQENRHAWAFSKAANCYAYSQAAAWKTIYDGADATIQANRLDTWFETIGNPIVYKLWANFNPTVTALTAEHGTITYGGEGPKEVVFGYDSEVYTITAEDGYVLSDVLLDGVPVTDLPEKATTYSTQLMGVTAPRTITFAAVPNVFTITYQDDAEGEAFPAQVYLDVVQGSVTPAFDLTDLTLDINGNPSRDGFVFVEWSPAIDEFAIRTVTYHAQWAVDSNNNDIPDDTEFYTISWYNDQGATADPITTERVKLGTVIDFTEAGRTPADEKPSDGVQTFQHWKDAAGNQYGGSTGNNAYTVAEDVTLLAVWKSKVTPPPVVVPPSATPGVTVTTAPVATPAPTAAPVVVAVATPAPTAQPTVQPTATPAPTATPVPTAVIEQEEPLQEPDDLTELEAGEVPLVAQDNGDRWALVNLLLAIATVATSIVLLAGYLMGHHDIETEARAKSKLRLFGLLPAVAAVVAFALTQDMTTTMVLVDKWTILMLLVALVQMAVALVVRKNEGEQEESTFI